MIGASRIVVIALLVVATAAGRLRAQDGDRAPLPPHALALIGTEDLRTREPIMDLAFSPDGRVIAAAEGTTVFLEGRAVRRADGPAGRADRAGGGGHRRHVPGVLARRHQAGLGRAGWARRVMGRGRRRTALSRPAPRPAGLRRGLFARRPARRQRRWGRRRPRATSREAGGCHPAGRPEGRPIPSGSRRAGPPRSRLANPRPGVHPRRQAAGRRGHQARVHLRLEAVGRAAPEADHRDARHAREAGGDQPEPRGGDPGRPPDRLGRTEHRPDRAAADSPRPADI